MAQIGADTEGEIDFERHNEEVKAVWEAYRAGKPTRVPMILGIQPRYTMFGHDGSTMGRHKANPRGITFEQYLAEPEVMLNRELEHLEWCAFNLMQDAEMGLPEVWNVWPDFQNVYEAASWGCPIKFVGLQVPDTLPAFGGEDGKRALLDATIPDPFDSPFFRKVWEFYGHFRQREEEGFEWKGRPIKACAPSGLGTDGPLTVCCNLRGTADFCLDLMEDPMGARALLDKVTDAIILHVLAFKGHLGQQERTEGWGFADDSIALLGTDTYAEFVLPCHRRMIETFSSGGPNSIHLCGDATRHFPFLKRELNIKSFDTGFPVDFGRLRTEVGEDVEILGGPSVPFLAQASPEEVQIETRRILDSGIKKGGRFILREGNNLAPEITPENVAAMYEACRQWGKYEVPA